MEGKKGDLATMSAWGGVIYSSIVWPAPRRWIFRLPVERRPAACSLTSQRPYDLCTPPSRKADTVGISAAPSSQPTANIMRLNLSPSHHPHANRQELSPLVVLGDVAWWTQGHSSPLQLPDEAQWWHGRCVLHAFTGVSCTCVYIWRCSIPPPPPTRWSLGQLLRSGRLAVVFNASYGGLAEEAVLVVHQVLVDAGSGKTQKMKKVSLGIQDPNYQQKLISKQWRNG